MTEIRHQYATVRGHRVFYREAGPRDAPALVLLHGFPTSSRMFRRLIPRLADRFRVIAPDHLGFGYDHSASQFGVLGLWAAEVAGKSGDEAEAYAREVVQADVAKALVQIEFNRKTEKKDD